MNVLVQTDDALLTYSMDFRTQGSLNVTTMPKKIISQNTQLVMMFDDSVKFFKLEQQKFSNSTCKGENTFTNIVYDKKKAGVFWLSDRTGKLTSF